MPLARSPTAVSMALVEAMFITGKKQDQSSRFVWFFPKKFGIAMDRGGIHELMVRQFLVKMGFLYQVHLYSSFYRTRFPASTRYFRIRLTDTV